MKRWSRRALMLELLLALPAAAQVASPHAIDTRAGSPAACWTCPTSLPTRRAGASA